MGCSSSKAGSQPAALAAVPAQQSPSETHPVGGQLHAQHGHSGLTDKPAAPESTAPPAADVPHFHPDAATAAADNNSIFVQDHNDYVTFAERGDTSHASVSNDEHKSGFAPASEAAAAAATPSAAAVREDAPDVKVSEESSAQSSTLYYSSLGLNGSAKNAAFLSACGLNDPLDVAAFLAGGMWIDYKDKVFRILSSYVCE